MSVLIFLGVLLLILLGCLPFIPRINLNPGVFNYIAIVPTVLILIWSLGLEEEAYKYIFLVASILIVLLHLIVGTKRILRGQKKVN